jgi:hypothetical protein
MTGEVHGVDTAVTRTTAPLAVSCPGGPDAPNVAIGLPGAIADFLPRGAREGGPVTLIEPFRCVITLGRPLPLFGFREKSVTNLSSITTLIRDDPCHIPRNPREDHDEE